MKQKIKYPFVRTVFLSVSGLVLSYVPVVAQQQIKRSQLTGGNLNTITTAVPFLMIAPDTRAGGMGDAGVASSPDANSIHWNASKLAFAEKKMAFSLSYAPWLHNLVNDINLAYLSGYYKAKKDLVMGGSLRYFSLGNIVFTDVIGNPTGQFKPNEFALDFAVAKKLGRNFSGGGAIRYIYSNLTGNVNVQGVDTRPGMAFAVDINGYYQNKEIKVGGKKATISSGLNISNIGTKISYSSTTGRSDFIPINMRLGGNLTMQLDEFNVLSFLLDFNKLLVPTPPIYDTVNHRNVVVKGKDPNRSVAEGIFGSFNDAPGGYKEELKEITYSVGMEYVYDKQFAFRMGYFYEDPTKGNRKFFTFGAGLKYNVFGVDLAYLVAQQRHPLANTLRFTLTFDFDAFKAQNDVPATN